MAQRRAGGRRWAIGLVTAAALGLVPCLTWALAELDLDIAVWLFWVALVVVFGFALAGPLVACVVLLRSQRLRLAMGGGLVVALPVFYLVSQHRPDSVIPPPPSDWLVSYPWLGGLACVIAVGYETARGRNRDRAVARLAVGWVVLASALAWSGVIGWAYSYGGEAETKFLVAPVQQSEVLPLPAGWTIQRSWAVPDFPGATEDFRGVTYEVTPPEPMPGQQAVQELRRYLRDVRGWRTRCRPVRGMLVWEDHCIDVRPSRTPGAVELSLVTGHRPP